MAKPLDSEVMRCRDGAAKDMSEIYEVPRTCSRGFTAGDSVGK